MINSIVRRQSRLDPYTEAEINIIRSAAKLFLENGYTKTTFKMIEADSGVKIGNITYYFRSKEELFKILVEELIEFHMDIIDEAYEKSEDPVFAFALEIAVQIALCENNRNAWDLYYSAYSLPHIYEHIQSWAKEKNYHLFKERLPNWDEMTFKEKEVVASGIELAALKTFCDRSFTLEKKISLILDTMMMIYEIEKEERNKIIEQILAIDYNKIAEDMFSRFVKRLDRSEQ